MRELGLPMDQIEDKQRHNFFAARKIASFIGREELVLEAKGKILQISGTTNRAGEYCAITAAVIVQSEAVKTALMSKLASETMRREDDSEGKEERIPVIVRFCGTYRLSLHGKDLIESISFQILSLYERREEMTELLGKLASQNYEVAVL